MESNSDKIDLVTWFNSFGVKTRFVFANNDDPSMTHSAYQWLSIVYPSSPVKTFWFYLVLIMNKFLAYFLSLTMFLADADIN